MPKACFGIGFGIIVTTHSFPSICVSRGLGALWFTIDFRKVEEFFPSIFDSALSLHQFNMASAIMVK